MRLRLWVALACALAIAIGATHLYRRGAIAEHVVLPPEVGSAASTSQAVHSKESDSNPDSRSTHRVIISSAPAALPASGTPLKDIYAELNSRANAGDAAAATRLFEDVRNCSVADRMKRSLPAWIETVIKLQDDGNGPAHAKIVPGHMMQMTQDQYEYVQSLEPTCEGLSKEQLDSLPSASLLAARLGDVRALGCYVSSNLEYMPGLIDHPQWLLEFKENAFSLAQNGLAQGNWLVVHALATAYSGKMQSFLLTQVTNHDPVMAYAYLKLQRLGAPDAKAAASIDHQLQGALKWLTPAQQAAADVQAENIYAKNFANTPQDNAPGFYPYCWGH